MLNMTQYGYTGDNANHDVARVTAVHKARFTIVSAYGEGPAVLKQGAYYDGGMPYPTVGDFVRVEYNPTGDSRVTETLPRFSYFARNDFSGHAAGYVKSILSQAVAANFDTVFLMTSLNHDLSVRRMERYLALARQSGARPVVILTKLDLAPNAEDMARRIRQVSRDVPVLALSSLSGEGTDQLAPYLQPGKTLVFLGSSGVGKSTLLNMLAGEELMDTGGIRQDDSRGRHTTTRRQLFLLPSGAMVIDTPGMRELGLWQADEGLDTEFDDVEALISRCRFGDCRHRTEPGCAVKQALEDGALSAERWESYCRLKAEMRFVDDRAAALRSKTALFRQIARNSRKMDKRRMTE